MMRGERGQAAVELALVLPVLLLVLLGIAEFGRGLSAYLTVQHAAREGARLAVTGASDSNVDARVRDAASFLEGATDPQRLAVVVAPDPAARQAGAQIAVNVTYQFAFLVPYIARVVQSQLTEGFLVLSSSMSMRM